MNKTFQKLNEYREETYHKDRDEEKFLAELNKSLNPLERSLHQHSDIQAPFIFTFGPPRSGTTLITQLIAQCLDVGYINNFIARFWKAPVCGIRLSRILYGDTSFTTFQSDYGSTKHILDIHEFGYFWREWLQKHSFESIKHAKNKESEIDWEGLRFVLANIQSEFGKTMIFKNILGSYHLPKFKEILNQVLFIYIERDSIDSALSILDARKKYYDDPNIWWSYIPPEYEKIIDEDYWTQIAGQIYYLKKFYQSELEKMTSSNVIKISYRELCEDPPAILEQIRSRIRDAYGNNLDIAQSPPSTFSYRTYDDRSAEKSKFESAFKAIKSYEQRP